MSSTLPVVSRESFEAYCASLGIDANATRKATVTGALAAMLARVDESVDVAYAVIASGSLKNLK